jgi:hypothetical protein
VSIPDSPLGARPGGLPALWLLLTPLGPLLAALWLLLTDLWLLLAALRSTALLVAATLSERDYREEHRNQRKPNESVHTHLPLVTTAIRTLA